MITQQQLKDVLDYDSLTGKFFWKVKTSKRIVVGQEAGCLANGYVQIRVYGKLYYAHRLAWLYVHGVWEDFIDHRDTVKNNNWISNLRKADQTGNNRNVGITKANTTGFKGVNKHRQKWVARITVDYASIHLGVFDSPEDAAHAYDLAATQHHGSFAKTNQSMGLIA